MTLTSGASSEPWPHWRLGQKDLARESFESADRWLAAKPADADIDLLRREAADLLGLGERGPPAAPDPKAIIKTN